MSLTKLLESIGTINEGGDMKKIEIELLDGTTRTVYDNEGCEKSHCRYCGDEFDICNCDRTEHVYDKKIGGCVNCMEPFKPNGTGPSNSKFLHFLINLFWFNRWVRLISNLHDIGYWCGFLFCHKKHEDEEMLRRTVEKIENTWWLFPTSVWISRAEVNYEAVEHGGDSSFNWSGCVLPENVGAKIKKVKEK